MEMQFNPITTQLDMVGGGGTGGRGVWWVNDVSLFILSDSAVLLNINNLPLAAPEGAPPRVWPYREMALPEGFVFAGHIDTRAPLFVAGRDHAPLAASPVGYLTLIRGTRFADLIVTVPPDSLPEGAYELYSLPRLAHVRKTGDA